MSNDITCSISVKDLIAGSTVYTEFLNSPAECETFYILLGILMDNQDSGGKRLPVQSVNFGHHSGIVVGISCGTGSLVSIFKDQLQYL